MGHVRPHLGDAISSGLANIKRAPWLYKKAIDSSIPDSDSVQLTTVPTLLSSTHHTLYKMLSFKSIAVFATLAFGAISSMAAPVVDNAIVARCDACDATRGIAGIMIDVKTAVTPYVNELRECCC